MNRAPGLSQEDLKRILSRFQDNTYLKDHFAVGGGSWLTLRHPRISRHSGDLDMFSGQAEVSSEKALREIQGCLDESEVIRRGEHFCAVLAPFREIGRGAVKIEIGKIWRPINPQRDDELFGFMLLSPQDMVREKIHCVLDRIEPTDLYDLCRLHQRYPKEFETAVADLKKTQEMDAFLVGLQQCLEKTGGIGTKMQLTPDEKQWLGLYMRTFTSRLPRRDSLQP